MLNNQRKKFNLNEIYSFLYYKFNDNSFDFKEISDYLEKDHSIPSRLVNNGYLIPIIDKLDNRKKEYRLIPPIDRTYALGFLTEIRKLENKLKNIYENIKINELLAYIHKHLKFLISGIWAYNYYIPTNIGNFYDLKIRDEDVFKFYVIFNEFNFKPLIIKENLIINKPDSRDGKKKKLIILDASLSDDQIKDVNIINELPILSPEYLIIDFLIKEEDVYYPLGLMLSQDLKFEKLIELATWRDCLGKLCFLIQVLEKILNKKYYFHDEIVDLKPKKIVSYVPFPNNSILQDKINLYFNENEKKFNLNDLNPEQINKIKEDEDFFKDLGKEWGIKSFLKLHQIKKVIEDINKNSWSKYWKK